jgi:hypothetical protein
MFSDKGGVTNRQRVTANTGKGTCGDGCHSTIINPIGFAFENYDALGRYRTTDNGQPVDAADTYAFGGVPRAFANALELVRLIASSDEAHRCFAGALLEYLHGRPAAPQDAPLVTALARRSLADRASLKALALALVTGDAFLTRLAAAP